MPLMPHISLRLKSENYPEFVDFSWVSQVLAVYFIHVSAVMAINEIRVSDRWVTARQKKRGLQWPFAVAAVLFAAVAILAFDLWSGKLGIIDPGYEIVQSDTGRVIKVPPGGNLQAAINRALGGDTIELQAGTVYKGAFKLPNKSGAEFITIRTSAPDAQLPASDTRLDPKRYAATLPKIVSNVQGQPAIETAAGAHHYRFLAIEFGPTPEGYFNIIQLGTSEERSVEELPHHIEFDRVYVHGDPTVGQRRGIAANGRHIKVANSYFSDIKREGEESQAIAVWAADGPIEIINNYLEAASESILFGGAESRLALIPGNAIIRDNWLNKPLEWRGSKWTIKNFLEVKSGRKIRIENNLMTNNWEHAQEGTGLVFRTADDSGKGSYIEDIELIGNIIRGAGSAVNIFGGEARGGRRLTIRNNVFEDVNSKKWGGRGFFLKSTTWDDLVIENNTVIHDGSITLAYGDPIRGMVFRNNIVFNNEYGFFGDGVGSGRAALNKYFPGFLIASNVIVGGSSADYGSVNSYPSNAAQIGFAGGGDYRLRGDSRYIKKGADGNSIGANLDPRTVGGK